MKSAQQIIALALLLVLPVPTLASLRHRQPAGDDGDSDVDQDADQVPDQVVPDQVQLSASRKEQVPTAQESSQQAHEAAKVAKQAAKVANKVAEHSIKITEHAKKSLEHAQSALHDARVESKDLDKDQKESLKKAEAHLREANKKAEYGELKKIKDEKDLQKEEMEKELNEKEKGTSEKEKALTEVEALREKLTKHKSHSEALEQELDETEDEIEKDGVTDETKAKIEELREKINGLDQLAAEEEAPKAAKPFQEPTPIEEKGIDVDTEMPYGDLEPFGREDTAQELTESSVKESDEMVDQLERAEVAEEKRAVFRALTRLRGAAITSFDGVARSQTGNIDEYAKTHKWRRSHPIHHLADEESDISKWAFPDNADFIQKTDGATKSMISRANAAVFAEFEARDDARIRELEAYAEPVRSQETKRAHLLQKVKVVKKAHKKAHLFTSHILQRDDAIFRKFEANADARELNDARNQKTGTQKSTLFRRGEAITKAVKRTGNFIANLEASAAKRGW